jgi:hypothetical protein
MKGFPKGWRPKKEKYRKAPTPPPGHDHGSLRDYERKRKKREDQNIIEEGIIDYETWGGYRGADY